METRDDSATLTAALESALSLLRAHHYIVVPPPDRARRTLYHGLRLDLGSCVATLNERSIALSPKEAKVLAILMAANGRTCSYAAIMKGAWPEDYSGDSLAVHVSILRRKLRCGLRVPDAITCVARHGYRLEIATESRPTTSPGGQE